MKIRYHLIGLLTLQLALSFCNQKKKRFQAPLIQEQVSVGKKEKKPCCTSRTPARFSVKNTIVKTPTAVIKQGE